MYAFQLNIYYCNGLQWKPDDFALSEVVVEAKKLLVHEFAVVNRYIYICKRDIHCEMTIIFSICHVVAKNNVLQNCECIHRSSVGNCGLQPGTLFRPWGTKIAATAFAQVSF